MQRIKIGKWNSYNVFMNKNKEKVYWTIEDNKGNITNKFESKESFGHWVFHSGFKPGNDKKLILRRKK